MTETADRSAVPVVPDLALVPALPVQAPAPPAESATGTGGSPLRIALLGTRGVPAAYGGFETAVEEIGRRLAARGHDVLVPCRTTAGGARPAEHLGMRLVHLPALRRRSLETLSHTALSVAHLLRSEQVDAAVLFNAANSPFLPLLHAAGVPVATHVDGLEWQRSKWGPGGRRYYRAVEALAVRWSDALIADAQGIADYYRSEFGAATELIAYGAPVQVDAPVERLPELGLVPQGYHLVVARFEPENHVHLAVEAHLASRAELPLVVVGAAPYAQEYTERIRRTVGDDPRVRLLGAVYDQPLLDELYAHARCYVHGHSVGGTNPSLLRAMGAATAVLAYDVVFNREVLGDDGLYWSDVPALTALLERLDRDDASAARRALAAQERVATRYRWDDVADRYESLCRDLVAGRSRRAAVSGRRR